MNESDEAVQSGQSHGDSDDSLGWKINGLIGQVARRASRSAREITGVIE